MQLHSRLPARSFRPARHHRHRGHARDCPGGRDPGSRRLICCVAEFSCLYGCRLTCVTPPAQPFRHHPTARSQAKHGLVPLWTPGPIYFLVRRLPPCQSSWMPTWSVSTPKLRGVRAGCALAGRIRGSQRGRRHGPRAAHDTWSAASSTPRPRAGCGSPTSPSTAPARTSFYFCAIKDCFSNRIVGYSISERMRSSIVVATVESTVARRGQVAGCVLHSDYVEVWAKPRIRRLAWSSGDGRLVPRLNDLVLSEAVERLERCLW